MISFQDDSNFTIESKESISDNPSAASSNSQPKVVKTSPTISLPGSVFERISDTNRTGLVFTLYEESTLFPMTSNGNDDSNTSVTMVGSRVIAANVAQTDTIFEDLQEPIIILLPLETGEKVSVLLDAPEVERIRSHFTIFHRVS